MAPVREGWLCIWGRTSLLGMWCQKGPGSGLWPGTLHRWENKVWLSVVLVLVLQAFVEGRLSYAPD